ncbi:PREDICTED: uncharacterized protein LOC104820771 isoform X2 [Tarenaya hassleriana]|uniref:uncharacterized protein LOC104820771 isoform X2 n=1 Tax=Tarenaya hassleriana TaxID=28532 RepID=UPI00053C60C3|nr:PREDICTED: uncharacterized protein LOC104820771 isoform X2 [Tarenaya hassleriana]
MEGNGTRTLERVVSEKAMKLGSSFPCQICVVGFLCGICLTSLFLAAITSLAGFELAGISFSAVQFSSSSQSINMVGSIGRSPKPTEQKLEPEEEDSVNLLVSAWEELLKLKHDDREVFFFKKLGLNRSNVPNAPHLENCKLSKRRSERLDTRIGNETFPPWTSWKGGHHQALSEAERAYPPWVDGADEDNYPLTRKVQRDLWIHQHPPDCENPNVKFLVVDWERPPGFGIGAQIAGMTGFLAIAVKENRVLVTDYYNRADHDGCRGPSRASWSCYFLPETSRECRDRAFELVRRKEAWETGTVTRKHNYSSKEIWSGSTPRLWGEPWNYMKPTTEINGSFVSVHRKMDRRWWRAQAVRYLMRFQTEYTCGLMNAERHSAFGFEAAKLVLSGVNRNWPKEAKESSRSEMEEYVWSNHKPWIPRPLLSVHVRMGDKACEMKIVALDEYMRLADRIRARFPHLKSIWLSTEMKS